MTLAPARTSILPDRISTPTLRTFLRAVPSVDEVGVGERVGALSKRSIKKDSKRAALDLIIRMIDLTTLEGKDTAGKVAQMSAKAIRPDPTDLTIPSAAAVCVYPNMVSYAVEATSGTSVHVASVATYFPSGLADIQLKVAETKKVVADGADEVDMVIDRGAFLSGEYFKVFDEIRRVKEACGEVHLKVILETGELGGLDNVRRASMLAMGAGADFHQDIYREDPTGRHPPGDVGDAGGDTGFPRVDGCNGWNETRGWNPYFEGRDQIPRCLE